MARTKATDMTTDTPNERIPLTEEKKILGQVEEFVKEIVGELKTSHRSDARKIKIIRGAVEELLGVLTMDLIPENPVEDYPPGFVTRAHE